MISTLSLILDIYCHTSRLILGRMVQKRLQTRERHDDVSQCHLDDAERVYKAVVS